jgi:hypothetical protein
MNHRSIGCLLVLLFVAAAAAAQDDARGRWVYDTAGFATPGFVYDIPPEGFDPVTAPDAELAQYGFPPRPTQRDKARFLSWKKIALLRRVPPPAHTHSYLQWTSGRRQD